jgi:hypothetical protein
VGEASVVAVNSRVGSGVSVGGGAVKVETNVGGSGVMSAGWNGVGVRDASGFGVTSASPGEIPSAVGREQAVSDRKIPSRKTPWRRRFIGVFRVEVFIG